ncbi:tRNA (cytidine(34)-2'-O)-methyltransferase [Dokdonia sp.]|uniref:tRNA (cytidine(34)-2'-O)-methyltransferase n=1 Tax=Dokdonia sp. TaxID=2024995 RepID=UPI00326338A3
MLNIVLIHPEIPNNTGNIGRLCLGSGCRLHLVKPFGFEIDDTRLKRAGLDYWKHLDVQYYENIDQFFEQHAGVHPEHGRRAKFAFLSSHGTKSHYEIPFEEELFLVFGKESKGLPIEVTERYPEQLYKIPLFSEHIRSLNLANAVGIVAYEGIRQLNLKL